MQQVKVCEGYCANGDFIWDIQPDISVTDCKYSPNGIEYLGFTNVSTSGKRCLEWRDVSGIKLPFIDEFYGGNFCRMARSTVILEVQFAQPWCFTVDGPELCDIPYCGKWQFIYLFISLNPPKLGKYMYNIWTISTWYDKNNNMNNTLQHS